MLSLYTTITETSHKEQHSGIHDSCNKNDKNNSTETHIAKQPLPGLALGVGELGACPCRRAEDRPNKPRSEFHEKLLRLVLSFFN